MTEYWDGLLQDMRTALKSSSLEGEDSYDPHHHAGATTEVPSSPPSPLSSSSSSLSSPPFHAKEENRQVISLCESHFDEISQLLLDYVSTAVEKQRNHASSPSPLQTAAASNNNVYRALRFTLAAVSCPIRTIREHVQLLTVSSTLQNTHDTTNPPLPLYMPICYLISQPMIPKKIRNLAAKILCNIGTCNGQTAQILFREIPPSPKKEEIARLLLEKLTCQPGERQDDIVQGDGVVVLDATTFLQQVTCTGISWSQMIYECGKCGDRESLAALVAALYNALHSCLQGGGNDENVTYFKSLFSSDTILLSNLIRYILPRQVLEPRILAAAAAVAVVEKNDKQDDLSDDATEWISRWIEKLSCLGFLPDMYAALGGGEEKREKEQECDPCHPGNHGDQEQQQTMDCGILPEQLVLLHCIGSSLDEYTRAFATSTQQRADMIHPLGENFESMKQSCLFLAHLYCKLRQRMRCNENIQERYDGEMSCIENGSNVILDVLSSCLSVSVDEPSLNDFHTLRKELGESTNIMQTLVWDLGMIVDRLDFENRGINARELKIKACDQHHVTSLVRLIGNISYKCRFNQDLVRMTSVPLVKDTTNSESTRNGLHVLLSCTSFAYGCFTLREWAIVAIRNVLEDNDENQNLIQQLEAQQALNTPELEKLGVKVHLDRKGHVHVSPKE
jgi:Spinocerebellar ataxia type 10 protein domain.